jgi:hypothetical protein
MGATEFKVIGAAMGVGFLIYGAWILKVGRMPSRWGGWITRRENPFLFHLGLFFVAATILLCVLVATGVVTLYRSPL